MAFCPSKFLIMNLLNKPTPIDVWIQGTIEQIIGNDIIVISDQSGKATIIKCSSADGADSSLKIGTYCCVIGILVQSAGLPVIQASKFVNISNHQYMKAAWNVEVAESHMLLDRKADPSWLQS